jgi:SPX domain protein involved in polyphosphate accumulation
MVEFGLKLEDNKVAAWGDHYLRYELLKECLDKAKKVQTKLDNLKEKRPELYQTVLDSLARGLPTPASSKENLIATTSEHSKSSPPRELVTISEQEEPLLPKTPEADSTYGSVQDTPSLLVRSMTTLSDYLGISFERQVRDAWKELDKIALEFDVLLMDDLDKVNSFYNRKLTDLQARLDLLKDGVSQTYSKRLADPETMQHADGEYLETPLVRNRKRSIVQEAVEKIQRKSTMLMHRRSHSENLPLGEGVEEENDQGLKQEQIQWDREVDSIQRALMDLYRRAKLLQNFAIMNYTGFIKIVKKHDKTLKDHKGRYKQAVRAENVCNEGKAVEKLAEYMERLYAAWFCDRNISEARAQLLPKRGDGLEMDWSQMRLGCKFRVYSMKKARWLSAASPT